ncbi:uncharacterized protein FA14DRAFT_171340 [Meira miltonrushii]|uniref:Uncharacterized protein n=1 Tax=Meira miltonrushii TaxID=1280837 RepID=A0A316VEZ0_9BASI|nr:uncharacterized protein FA14DRAFT_171340 [Meira miltonrushii]PWN34571.1 hypothetical protein FA14DRAFT_171340 [Meira miltonrushii]
MPGKSNKELEKEHKQIEQKPEDLKDTDVENEYKEGNKQGFRKQTGSVASATGSGEAAAATSPPTNKQLESSQKQESLKPEDLKDTDADDEYKEQGGKFKKNTGKARL